MARHVEMEPTSPADACLKAAEIRHRDDDPAAAAECLDRAAQAELGVVEVLEHVPEDDQVGTLRGGAERLDRRVANFWPCVPRPCVRLEPHDCAALLGQLAEKPAVTRSDFDHPRPRREWAERTEDCSLPEAAQRLEQPVDDSGRLGVCAAAVQAGGVTSGATDRHSRAARPAAIQAVETLCRPPVGSAYRDPGLYAGATAGNAGRLGRRHQYAPRRRKTGTIVRARMRRSRPIETFSM